MEGRRGNKKKAKLREELSCFRTLKVVDCGMVLNKRGIMRDAVEDIGRRHARVVHV